MRAVYVGKIEKNSQIKCNGYIYIYMFYLELHPALEWYHFEYTSAIDCIGEPLVVIPNSMNMYLRLDISH